MVEAYYKEHESWLFLLVLSISLHTTLLLVFFILHPLYEPLPIKQLRTDTQDVIPLSQAQNQGATIIFQEEPEQKAPTPSEIKQAIKPSLSKIMQEVALPKKESLKEDVEEPEHHEKIDEIEKTEQEPEPFHEPVIAQKTIPLEKISVDKPKKRASKSASKPSQAASSAQAAQALAKISQGFIQSMEQEQGNTPPIQHDFDMLARHMYASKVFRMLSQTVNCHQKKTHLNKNITTDANLIIKIDSRGKLLDFVVEHPQKNREILEIEGILSTAARQAGLYPPIPASFKTDVMTLRCPVHIEGEEGFHMYRLYTR